MSPRAWRAIWLTTLLATAPLRAQDGQPPELPPAEEPPAGVPEEWAGRHPGGPDVLPDDPLEAPPTAAPVPAATPEMLARLASNALLRDLPFRGETCDPVDVLVQPPAKPDERHVTRTSWILGTWVRGLHTLFRMRYAEPARRQARDGRDRLTVVAVTDPALFDELRGAAHARDAWDQVAFHDPQLAAVIVLDADPAGPRAAADLVRPMLHASVHALLDAWGEPGRVPPAWFAEGLAEQLASHADVYSERLGSLGVFDTQAFAALAQVSFDRTQRIACLRPLADLTAIATLADLDARVAGLRVPDSLPLLGFTREASLFLHWLDTGELATPDRAEQMVVGWLSGRDVAPRLPGPPDELEGPFVGWAQDQIARRLKLDPAAFTLRPETVTAEEIRPGVLARPADLAVPEGGLDLEWGRALQLAARGDLRAAEARCGELALRPGTSATDASGLKDEQRRLAALQQLRHRWLAEHVGKMVELHEGDAVLRTTLQRLDGEGLVVKDKGRERALPEQALVPSVLAAQLLAPGTNLVSADDGARALAWLLAADPAWKDKTAARIRSGSGPAAVALLDRRADYEAHLAVGRAIEALESLAAVPLPLSAGSEADREAWLARLKALLADGTLPVVAERRRVLAALGAQVLGARFDAAPLEHVGLNATVEELPAGRIRASWTFSESRQLQDWVARPFERDDISSFGELGSSPSPAGLAVEEGALVARASGRWRCKLRVAAPFSIDYDLRYGYTPAEAAARAKDEEEPDVKVVEGFAMRMCADDYGSCLACSWFGSLLAFDKRIGEYVNQRSALAQIFLDTRYHVRLEHDGERLHAIVDGHEASSVTALHRTQGALEIWHHTERPIVVDDLVVEGPLDVAGMAPERAAWVAGELAALGAGD